MLNNKKDEIKDIYETPSLYFKEAIREARLRSKLCELYSNYFEDIAIIEENYGKNIVKIGANNRMVAKEDWPVETNRVLDQVHISSEKLGKQHIGYSLCISQSIAREFNEHSKTNGKKIQELELKMQNMAEDIIKTSKSYKKKHTKYLRLIQDAESSIIARDAAIRDYAEKINNTTDEGFFNRSLTMVLGKVTPTDAMKKQHEKCRSLIHEIDQIEIELTELSNTLIQKHHEFTEGLSSSLHEVDKIENSRLDFIKSGLLRFHQANTGMTDHLTQIFDNLKNAITSLDIHIDVEAFERELESAKLSFRETNSLGSQLNPSILTNTSSTNSSSSSTNTTSTTQTLNTNLSLNNNNNNNNNSLSSTISTTNDNITSVGIGTSEKISTSTSSSTSTITTNPITTNQQFNNQGNQNDANSQIMENLNQLRIEDDESSHLYKSNLMVFDRLKDAIESFKRSAQRATGTFADISDIEKIYSKSTLKLLDKHGYGEGNITSTTNMISSSFSTNEPKINELSELYESKLCHSGWNHIIEVTHKLSEAHLTVSEVLLDKCCVITDNAQRRIDTIMREAIEKVHHVNKKIDGAKATQLRLKTKLNRVQKELRDRRTLSNSPNLSSLNGNSGRKSGIKDDLLDTTNIINQASSSSSSNNNNNNNNNSNDVDLNGDGSSLDTSSNRISNNLSLNDSIDISNHTTSSTPSTSTSTTSTTTSTPNISTPISVSSQRPKSEKGMIQGWESIGNAFGAVAVTALGAAGVLESSSDRNNNRIANLEEEESACIESLNTANSSAQIVVDYCVNDLSAIIMTLKQGISKEMENMKSSLILFIDGHSVGLNISLNVLHRLKYITDEINTIQDMKHFHSNIITAANSNEERKVPNLFLLPQFEHFVAINNELVTLERENEKESIESSMISSNEVPSTSLYSATSVTTSNFKNKSLITSTPRRRRSLGNSTDAENESLGLTNFDKFENESHQTNNNKDINNNKDNNNNKIPQVSVVSVGLQPPPQLNEQFTSSSSTTTTTTIVPIPSPSTTSITSPIPLELNSKSNQGTPEKIIKKENNENYKDNKDNISNNQLPLGTIVAPSECSVPDYGEDPLESFKIVTSPIQEKIFQDDETIIYPSESATISDDDEQESIIKNFDRNTPLIRASSNEIGSYNTSPEEGLRRSVNTELRSVSDNNVNIQENSNNTRPVFIPPREESWTSSELAKFDLPPTEKILEYFTCALYPKRGLLTHGRLYITNRYLAFTGWPEAKVLIELKNIENIEKKQMFFIPNALTVKDISNEEYFFGSFLDRDLCFRMLTSMVMIAKSLGELTGDDNNINGNKHRRVSYTRLSNGNIEKLDESNNVIEEISIHNDDNNDNNDDHNIIEESDDESENLNDDENIDFTKLPNYMSLFNTNSVSSVYDYTTNIASSLVWRVCWQEKIHFTDFLTSVGDFDILATDWIPFTSTLTKNQDPLGLKYQYKRTVDYLHPRTSMLMFGPKNATAKQLQYLYLPELNNNNNSNNNDNNNISEHIEISNVNKIHSGCILTATQFEGIPMSDVFEVLQYWTFQKVSSDKCIIRIGATVNFLKSTLMKGQILSGVKEELAVLAKQWCDYSLQSIERYIQNIEEKKLSLKSGRKSLSSTSLSEKERTLSISSTRRKSATKLSNNELNQISTNGHNNNINNNNNNFNGDGNGNNIQGLNNLNQQLNSTNVNTQQLLVNGPLVNNQKYTLIIFFILLLIIIFQLILLYLMYRQMIQTDETLQKIYQLLHLKQEQEQHQSEVSSNESNCLFNETSSTILSP